MGKYEKQTPKKKKNPTAKLIPVIIVVLVLLFVLVIAVIDDLRKIPELEVPKETNQETQNTQIEDTIPNVEKETIPDVEVETKPEEDVKLDQQLQIKRMDNYAGIYMEDGTQEAVSNVMMIILENTSEQDLQLARISVVYEDFTAEFEATNLPAGESVVALERNRQSMPQEAYQTIDVRNVIFFDEKMTLMEEKFEITGGDGYLEITNISGEDIAGQIYIYYKYSAVDLLYGGITYRASFADGLKAGETARTSTGHYSESGSRIVHVTCGG